MTHSSCWPPSDPYTRTHPLIHRFSPQTGTFVNSRDGTGADTQDDPNELKKLYFTHVDSFHDQYWGRAMYNNPSDP